jgi:hypothetical protein
VAEEFGVNSEPEVLDQGFLEAVEFIGQNDWEFFRGINVVQPTAAHFAHASENLFVVVVAESEAAGADGVFEIGGVADGFDFVRVGDALVEMAVGEEEKFSSLILSLSLSRGRGASRP